MHTVCFPISCALVRQLNTSVCFVLELSKANGSSCVAVLLFSVRPHSFAIVHRLSLQCCFSLLVDITFDCEPMLVDMELFSAHFG